MGIFLFGLVWLGGIAAGETFPLNTWEWILLFAISLVAVILFRGFNLYRWVFLAFVVFLLGMARLQVAQPEFGPDHLSHYNDLGTRLTITGTIIDDPDVRDTYVGLRMDSERLWIRELQIYKRIEGRLLLYAPRNKTWSYGDRIRVHGYVETPPNFDTFSYREYLARQGIHSIIPDPKITFIRSNAANPLLKMIYDFRQHARKTIRKLFPDPEASLLEGILIGIESGISPEVRETFNRTGTTHIIAISGFNVTILAAVFMAGFGRWFGARIGAVFAGIAILLYTILVGADATVVRAAIMAGLVIYALRIGRQTDGLASLSAAVFLMTIVNPNILWDVGFQLSFAATLGLVVYASPLHDGFVRISSRWFPQDRVKDYSQAIAEVFLYTIAAQLTTLPLMMYYFRRLSLISIIANPLILPVQPLLMILGGIATLIGMLWIPLARPIAALAWPFPAFTIHTVAALSNWPYASVGIGHIGFGTVFVFYAALGLLTWILLTPPGKNNLAAIAQRIKSHIRIPAIAILIVLMIMTGLTWTEVMRQPDGMLHITILDVGQGEAVLIQTPHAQNVLINGGPRSIRLSDALGRRLSVSNRSVDVLLLTHDDPVHIGALQGIADQYTFDLTLVSGEFQGTTYRKLAEKLQNPDTALVQVEAGHRLSFGEDASLEVLATGDRGAVILVRYRRARIVLASGAGPNLTSALTGDESIKKVNAVLLSDGGNPAANPPQWLSDLDPDLVLLSANKEQLPSADLLRQLMGRTILRTDLHGSIELVTDGGRLWVQVERNPTDSHEVSKQERTQTYE